MFFRAVFLWCFGILKKKKKKRKEEKKAQKRREREGIQWETKRHEM
jgi:hypothetical protein